MSQRVKIYSWKVAQNITFQSIPCFFFYSWKTFFLFKHYRLSNLFWFVTFLQDSEKNRVPIRLHDWLTILAAIFTESRKMSGFEVCIIALCVIKFNTTGRIAASCHFRVGPLLWCTDWRSSCSSLSSVYEHLLLTMFEHQTQIKLAVVIYTILATGYAIQHKLVCEQQISLLTWSTGFCYARNWYSDYCNQLLMDP